MEYVIEKLYNEKDLPKDIIKIIKIYLGNPISGDCIFYCHFKRWYIKPHERNLPGIKSKVRPYCYHCRKRFAARIFNTEHLSTKTHKQNRERNINSKYKNSLTIEDIKSDIISSVFYDQFHMLGECIFVEDTKNKS